MNKIKMLRDTKITIEIEATTIPEEAYKPDLDQIPENEQFFPYSVTVRVKVGDQDIGLISRLNLALTSENPLPLVEADFLGGAKPLNFKYEELSPEVRDTLEKSVGLLRQFPFVQVNVPTVPVL